MAARFCSNCGRPLTESERQFGVSTCGECEASASGTPFTPAEQGTLPSQPPSAAEERDVVGTGRYILNFFLGGFVGLGLSYFLRYRGWLATWISLAVFILVVIVVSVVAVVGAIQEEAEAEAFVEELDDIMLDLNAGYNLPIMQAGLLLETDCTSVDPDPAIKDCHELMETLADANPSLATGIDDMKSLRRDIPGDAPEEIDQLMADMIGVLELEYESNLLLIEGWSDLDSTKWQQGWDLSFQAAAEGLDVAQNALTIAEELEE